MWQRVSQKVENKMTTGDPICGTCGQYKINCTCGTALKNFSYQSIPQGWECPRCHKVNAPSMKQCSCIPEEKKNSDSIYIITYPPAVPNPIKYRSDGPYWEYIPALTTWNSCGSGVL